MMREAGFQSRSRWIALSTLLSVVAGCSPSRLPTNATKLIDTAVLADVSASQQSIAYYLNETSQYVKTPDRVITVGDGTFWPSFGERGEALTFSSGATPSAEDPTRYFAALSLWTPAMSAPAKLSSGLAVHWSVPPDRSFVILFDAPNPTLTLQPGDVLLVRASDCAGNACRPITLATNVQATAVSSSFDGRFASYVVVNGTGAAALHETWIVDVAAGTTRKIAASSQSASSSFSPRGDLIAATTQTGILNRQLQVFSTTTAMPVTWAPQPMTTETVAVTFAEEDQLLARVHPTSITDSSLDSLYVMSGTAATPLGRATGAYLVNRRSTATARWLFMVDANRLLLLDLGNLSADALNLSTAFDAIPRISDDGTSAVFLDNYDSSGGSGSLTRVELATGTKTRIAENIVPRAYDFATGTTSILWLDAVDGTGMLREWKAGTAMDIAGPVFNFISRPSPPTVYLTTISTTGTESLNVDPGSPGIWSIPTP